MQSVSVIVNLVLDKQYRPRSDNLCVKVLEELWYLVLIYEPRREKNVFCIFENKGADQLCSNCTTDQCLCFHYIDSTIPLLPKSGISSLWLSSVVVQPGLCRT